MTAIRVKYTIAIIRQELRNRQKLTVYALGAVFHRDVCLGGAVIHREVTRLDARRSIFQWRGTLPQNGLQCGAAPGNVCRTNSGRSLSEDVAF